MSDCIVVRHGQTSLAPSTCFVGQVTLRVQLLSPTQVARCIVQGWPYTPDTLAICSWVAAEDGDAGALAVLTAPSRAPATSAAAWATSSNQGAFPGSNHNRGGRGEQPSASCHGSPHQHVRLCAVRVRCGAVSVGTTQGCASSAVSHAWSPCGCVYMTLLLPVPANLNGDVCPAGGMAASGSGQQNNDGHMNSMSKLPMSGSLPGSGDAQYNMGPANPSQHHSGSQAWASNEGV